MNDKPETTKSSVQLLTRFNALPTAKKALLGQLIIAHAINGEQLRQSAGIPADTLVPVIDNIMASLEPKA